MRNGYRVAGAALCAVLVGPVVAKPAPQAMVPAGPPENCVETNRIRSTTVLDDQTIDFKMSDGRTLRNTLPNRCPGLGFERAFGYSTGTSQLCNVDLITVVSQGAGPRRGASCGLGQFVPVKPEADAKN
jgi:hypothetical protein